MTLFNRLLWTFVGALLTAAGVVGVLARFNVMPGIPRGRALITPGMDARWRAWDPWATAGVIVVGVLLAILGALLFKAQFRRRGGRRMPNLTRTDRIHPSTVDTRTQSADLDGWREVGQTRVMTSTLSLALTRDLQRDVRVRSASVWLTGAPTEPDVRVQLSVTPEADVTELRRHVDRALGRFAATTGLVPHVAEVLVKMSSAQRERVH